MTAHRVANLDLIRASAIVAVVIHHLFVNWPDTPDHVQRYANLGVYGVDLFFVLSGWLIGGLCWSELAKTSKLDAPRFILSRVFRTVPPYMIALAISWAAVHFTRGERFRLEYLFFLQNYFVTIPFFLVSWSLCIEEQFYLILPALLKIAVLCGNLVRHIGVMQFFAIVVVVLSPILRITCGRVSDDFGYYTTAAQFRLEGLALGVWAAYIHRFMPSTWERLALISKWLWLPALLSLPLIVSFSPQFRYWFSYSWVSWAFAITLIYLVQAHDVPGAGGRFIRSAALWSYSIYLTHSLVLNVVVKAIEKFAWLRPAVIYMPISTVLIAITGALFYHGVEKQSFLLRARILKWYDLRKLTKH